MFECLGSRWHRVIDFGQIKLDFGRLDLSFQPFLEKNVGLMIDEVERMTTQVERCVARRAVERGYRTGHLYSM